MEGGTTVSAPTTAGDFMTAIYANVKMGATFTTGASSIVNGVRVKGEISTTTISHAGRLAAFECLTASGDQPWDYGLYVADSTIGVFVGACTTGVHLSGAMTTGIDIDASSSGADANYYGIDADVTQGSVSGGAYLSRGNLTGARSTCWGIGNIDHVYAMRSDAAMVMAANTEVNQHYAGLFSASVSGAFTFTLHDGHVGLQANASVDSGVTDVTGGLVAALFTNTSDVQKAITSIVYGIYVKAGGYTDFGQSIQVESNNLTAGLRVQATDSAVLPIGLQLSTSTGTITKQIEFTGGNGIYTGSGDPNGNLSAEDGSIYLRTGTANSATVVYACSGTTSWAAV